MDLMTIADVCVELKVGRRTVYRMVRDGVILPPKRIGNFRQSYFLRTEFERACRKQMR
jgi:excisionase family DNA binding protein